MIGPWYVDATPERGHLDDLAALRLADGEPVPAAAVAHAATCGLCAARVAACRAEAEVFSGALALDGEELAFLRQAQPPAQIAAQLLRVTTTPAGQIPAPAAQLEPPLSFLAILAVACAGYFGWLAALDVVAGQYAAVPAGLTAWLGSLLIGWTISHVQLIWDAIAAIARLPGIDTPALPVLVLALAVWLLVAVMPMGAGRQLEAV